MLLENKIIITYNKDDDTWEARFKSYTTVIYKNINKDLVIHEGIQWTLDGFDVIVFNKDGSIKATYKSIPLGAID